MAAYGGDRNAVSGVTPVADLTTGSPTNKQKVARVRALIANPDVAPAQAGQTHTPRGAGYLDEMSPSTAAALIAELTALESSITNV